MPTINFRCLHLIFVCAMAVFTGCDVVTVEKPFGTPVAAKELKEAVGRWSDIEHSIFELRMSKSGELVGGHLSWDDATEQFKGHSNVVSVRDAGDAKYLFIKEDESLMFFRVEMENKDRIVFYVPDPDVFRNEVKAGSLNGKINDKESGKRSYAEVKLAADEKLMAYLSRNEWRESFISDKTFVLTRLPAARD